MHAHALLSDLACDRVAPMNLSTPRSSQVVQRTSYSFSGLRSRMKSKRSRPVSTRKMARAISEKHETRRTRLCNTMWSVTI